MQVILEEAHDSYDEDIVIELHSDDTDQIDENVGRITTWIDNWIKNHPEGATSAGGPIESEGSDNDDE